MIVLKNQLDCHFEERRDEESAFDSLECGGPPRGFRLACRGGRSRNSTPLYCVAVA